MKKFYLKYCSYGEKDSLQLELEHVGCWFFSQKIHKYFTKTAVFQLAIE